MIMIYSNPESRELWQGCSDAVRAQGRQAYAELDADLAASGELVVAEALADPALARRLPARERMPARERVPDREFVPLQAGMPTDAPFAEAKEQLAGFILVDCSSAARATEIAARIPEAAFGLVEVRPVLAGT
jgi:hypothetical protein